jgi:hypothetical protein
MMPIKVSWIKYIFASSGLILVWVGIADSKWSSVVGGLFLALLMGLFGYALERLILWQRAKGVSISDGGKPITATKRMISGIIVIAFGALIGVFGKLGAGIFVVLVGVLILKPILPKFSNH